MRGRLLGLDGVLVWVNPIQDGANRSQLDALLREAAAKGVWVSADPEVILTLGTKEVLYRTRDVEAPDTPAYRLLRQSAEQQWVPRMKQAVGLDKFTLPAIWDADFLGAQAAWAGKPGRRNRRSWQEGALGAWTVSQPELPHGQALSPLVFVPVGPERLGACLRGLPGVACSVEWWRTATAPRL